MFKHIYLPNNILKHIDIIISKNNFIGDDLNYLKHLLNNLFGYNVICEITKISLLTLQKDNYLHSFTFDDANILPKTVYYKHENSIIEPNNYIFCICLEGSVCVEQTNKSSNFVKIINRGECFILNMLSKYIIHTFDPKLKLVIIPYNTLSPFIHYDKIICSEDKNIYEIFDGNRFALFCLFDEDNVNLESIIILNGKYYNITTLSEIDIFGLNSVLLKYNIYTNYLHYNSMFYQETNIQTIYDILNENNIFDNLIHNTKRSYVYSSDLKRYSIMLVYGIMK
ncbi:hypothetical protein BTW14_gp154 [BeAn 58058 virus]|uniref:hypothetical protein n=1 Tax=BeAn 58058 virus TaxID=67082 RepID=UPI00090C103D|nr:hypothetical protein BTW14_gp154 [BeAn 58058 virus]APG58345.1 hypothetical protein BAV00168 [BeAn 58058 virus]